MVTPRVLDAATREAPLEPAHLDEGEVLDQLEWRPPRRQMAAALLDDVEGVDLVDDPAAEVVEVAEEPPVTAPMPWRADRPKKVTRRRCRSRRNGSTGGQGWAGKGGVAPKASGS
jgi:hypothetical protein